MKRRLGEANNPKTRNKLAQLLQYATRGVNSNTTAQPADVLVFVHSVLSDGLAAEEGARARAQAVAAAALPRGGGTSSRSAIWLMNPGS